jgi:hypothetical protein
VTEPWAPPDAGAAGGADDEPGGGSRLGCAVALVVLFLAGFVGVGAVLLLRAPDGDSTLGALVRAPAGYVRLDDAEAGGGPLSADRAAALLARADVPGFQDGVLRAWGRRPGEPVRAVVVLAVEVGTAEQAGALRRDYAAAAVRRGATPFAPGIDGADAFQDVPDDAGRYAQRVVLSRGARLFVVSVVTPARDGDPAEVRDLAARQAAAL